MIEEEKWDQLYYAIIRINNDKSINLIGIGSTKLICRNSALEYLISTRGDVSDTFVRTLERVNIDESKISEKGCTYTMVYCEAKVYIYGKRYGFKGMKLVFDPTYRENLIRFAGFGNKSLGDKYNGRR